MSWTLLKKYREERAAHLGEMKAMLKKANDEAQRDLTPEETTKFDDCNAKAETRKADIDRLERAQALETELNQRRDQQREQRAGRDDVNTPETAAEQRQQEQRQQFDAYLRTGQVPAPETRALTVTGAGVVGDRTVYSTLVTSLKTFAGVREAGATVLPTTDGNDLDVPKADDTSNTGQIVGEATEDNTEADPSVGTVPLHAWKFDSKWIKVSVEMLQDAAYPLESYILGIAGERTGRSFNGYATTGSGNGQPKGIIPASGTGKVAAAINAFTFEELVDLIHSVDAGYRNSPGFRLMFHDTTLAAIRKLKDGGGRYIFAAGAAGIPSLVMEHRYVVNNSMPELSDGVSKAVVAAGDFSRYFVRDVTAVIVRRAEELFIGSGLIGFRVFSRHDGNLVDANAIKLLKTAAA